MSLNFSLYIEKLRKIDFVYLFEDVNKVNLSSGIKPPLMDALIFSVNSIVCLSTNII
jgi:hypothetical protein